MSPFSPLLQQLVPEPCEAAWQAGWCLGVAPPRLRPFIWALSGSGPDGAEEIKRHVFYSTIDWNVSVSTHARAPAILATETVVGGEPLLARAPDAGAEGHSLPLKTRAGLLRASNYAVVCWATWPMFQAQHLLLHGAPGGLLRVLW